MEKWDEIIKYEENIYNESKNEGINDTIEVFKEGNQTGSLTFSFSSFLFSNSSHSFLFFHSLSHSLTLSLELQLNFFLVLVFRMVLF